MLNLRPGACNCVTVTCTAGTRPVGAGTFQRGVDGLAQTITSGDHELRAELAELRQRMESMEQRAGKLKHTA
jgi:hypothetical protein